MGRMIVVYEATSSNDRHEPNDGSEVGQAEPETPGHPPGIACGAGCADGAFAKRGHTNDVGPVLGKPRRPDQDAAPQLPRFGSCASGRHLATRSGEGL